MIRIALVGEIASGKTFVAKCFRLPLFNADLEVKKIYKTNKNCFIKLNRKFPNNIKHYPIKKAEIKQILNKSNIKIAIGCTYKFLNGGPGSPSFLYVSRDIYRGDTE